MSYHSDNLSKYNDFSDESEPEDAYDLEPTSESDSSTQDEAGTSTTPVSNRSRARIPEPVPVRRLAGSEVTPLSSRSREEENVIISLLKQTNTLVKSLENRLSSVESKVAEMVTTAGLQAHTAVPTPSAKSKFVVSDQIRVCCTLSN